MLTKIKIYACYTVNIYKNKPQKIFKPGAPQHVFRTITFDPFAS